jgi:hypothetical protein
MQRANYFLFALFYYQINLYTKEDVADRNSFANPSKGLAKRLELN